MANRIVQQLASISTMFLLLGSVSVAHAQRGFLAIDGNTGPMASIDFEFIRADSNLDGVVEISDAVRTLQRLFASAPKLSCPDSADANDDGQVDISDPIFTLMYLFAGGAPPPAPFPVRGPDATPRDSLRCMPDPEEDLYVVSVRPLRCPAFGCDPWASGIPPAELTAERHRQALGAWLEGSGGVIRASWVQTVPDDTPNLEPFEIVTVVKGQDASLNLLQANSRLIQSPPGVMAFRVWPRRCGANHWDTGLEPGGADLELLLEMEISSLDGGKLLLSKREYLPGMEGSPQCELWEDGIHLKFKLFFAVSGPKALFYVMMSWGYFADLAFPLPDTVTYFGRMDWPALTEPWDVWWSETNPGVRPPLQPSSSWIG